MFPGRIFIEKAGGQASFLSQCTPVGLEQLFAQYEVGVRFKPYDLSITRIIDRDKTVDLLQNLDLTYVIPEFESGRTWRIPKEYTKRQLELMLEKPPCVFADKDFTFSGFGVLQEFIRSGCCVFHLSDHGDGDGSSFVPTLL